MRLVQQLDELEQQIWSSLGLEKYSLRQLGELLGDDHFYHTYQHTPIPESIFFEAIGKIRSKKMIELGKQGIITPKDVSNSLSRIEELGFSTRHKIGHLLRDDAKN